MNTLELDKENINTILQEAGALIDKIKNPDLAWQVYRREIENELKKAFMELLDERKPDNQVVIAQHVYNRVKKILDIPERFIKLADVARNHLANLNNEISDIESAEKDIFSKR